jgi:gamma-glutamyltranspeptidase / glutathione hydrolase
LHGQGRPRKDAAMLRTLRYPLPLFLLFLAPAALADRVYTGGVAAAAYPDATRAALEMLDRGGNAIDAAVAAAFAAGVVGPYHNGIGGGGLALVYLASSRTTLALDFREVAPAGASRDMYVRDGRVVGALATDGALSVAVPAATQGYLALLARAGTLSRSVVLGPAIRLARAGFQVTPKYQALARGRVDCLRRDAETARLFLRPGADGLPAVPALGTVLRQPELARTLERIAREGERAVTAGTVAEALDQLMRRLGGVLAARDLAAYRVRWREPLHGTYRGHALAAFPPPTAGGVTVLQVLGMLEQLRPDGFERRSPEDLHLYLEALRRSYVDRARWLGDPDFSAIPLQRLLSETYLGELARSIDPRQATPSASLSATGPATAPTSAVPGLPSPKNTTHLSVLDRQGNAVALSTTLNYGFGSCLVVPGTGILLNDQMDDFAAAPLRPNVYGVVTGEANAIAPGKTPLSSMAPTLVFQRAHPERVLLAVGSPGGATIPTTVLQVLINVLDARMDLLRAVGAGRVHEQWLPDEVVVDRQSLEPATRAALEAMGHRIRTVDALGDAEAVMEDEETRLRTAASDPRNEGAALGQELPLAR